MAELITINDESEACRLCNLKTIDEFRLGPLFQRDGFVAHYYCVLFSDKVPQRGQDDEGIMGFLVKDVKCEVNRVKRAVCDYCKKPSASIHCASKKCRIKFHYPCGIAKGSLHQFQGSFKSYCMKHRPVQDIPEKVVMKAEEDQTPCAICYDSVDYRSVTDTIWANCCCTTWYHRDCIQKHALSSGYFFKCAICNNDGKFRKWVEKYGIFVPQKDASWELEPNAFGELTRQYSQCDADSCKCPDGRECDIVDTMWEIILCRSCGSQGMHIMCGQLKFHKPLWQCELCKNVISKYHSERKRWSMKRIREGLNDTGQHISKVQSERNGDVDCATSSGRDRLSPDLTGNNGNIKQTRKRGQKRKRTDSQDGEKPVKRRCKRRRLVGSRAMRKNGTEEDGSANGGRLNRDLDALHVKEKQNNNNEADDIAENTARESNSAEDDDSDDDFTLEEIRRRRKIEENGFQVVDMKSAPSTTKEMNIIEVYQNYQMNEGKYRVKKELVVISDDEGEDSELEVILDGVNSQVKAGESRGDSDFDITMCVALQIPKNRNDGRTIEECAPVDSEVDEVDSVEIDVEKGEARKVDPLDEVTLLLPKRLDNSCVPDESPRNAADSVMSSRERSSELETLETFQAHIQKLIETELKQREQGTSSRTRRKSGNGNKSPDSNVSGAESGDDGSDIEVIEIVRSSRRSLSSSVGCYGSKEDIIEIE